MRVLGQELMKEMPIEAHVLFSHYHWDHMQGFPFFTPAFIPGNKIHIYGKKPKNATIEYMFRHQMSEPHFPVPMDIMQSKISYKNIKPNTTFKIKDIKIEVKKLNHAYESVGYKITWKKKSIAYISDTEHYPNKLDQNVVDLANNTDVFIYDAMYTDEEYHNPHFPKIGWGHSTWQEAVKIAKAAKTKELVVFHHDPIHDDKTMDKIAKLVKKAYPKSIMAKEGLEITL